MNVNEIIEKYKNGEASLEETNAALKEIDSGLCYDPDKNVIHPDEEERFGLLDTGTGSLDKVKVIKDENGLHLEEPVFNPESFKDCTLPVANVQYCYVWYKVADDGITLVKK